MTPVAHASQWRLILFSRCFYSKSRFVEEIEALLKNEKETVSDFVECRENQARRREDDDGGGRLWEVK